MGRTERPRGRPAFRIGCGLDLHPLRPGRPLMLGGLRVPHGRGLDGHSDADVLVHAVCDAVFGALGEGDLGARFPDTDARHRGRASLDFLKAAAQELRARGWLVGNIDAVVLAEAPRLAPHLDGMRAAIAGALGCPTEAISVRAKRAEGLGAVGRGEGMAAQAVALLIRAPQRGAPARRRRGRK